MESYKIEQKLDIIISILNNNMEEKIMRDMFIGCPYCGAEKEKNMVHFHREEYARLSKIRTYFSQGNIYKDDNINSFFEGASLVNCKHHKCKQKYYRTSVFEQYAGHGNPYGGAMVFAVSVEDFNNLKREYHYDAKALVEYLPEQGKLRECYKKLIESFSKNDDLDVKSMRLRKTIEAFVSVQNDREETTKILSMEITKLPNLNVESKEKLREIVRTCQIELHPQPEEIDKDLLPIAFKFIELMLTNFYKLEVEKEALDKSFKEKTETIDKEYQEILSNIK